MNVSNKRILIFGDSLTHPGADSDPEQSMVTGSSTRSSSAPGDLLGSLFLEAGASAVMLDANVGRSASNFWAGTASHQFHSANDLIAADQAFAPDIVLVMLGTNDIGTNLLSDQQAMQAIHDSFPQADVWAIGPMTYVPPGDAINAGAQAVFDMMSGVFGPERTIDARPLSATTGRAGDGVHFGPSAAYQTALALAAAFTSASGVSTTTTVMWGLAGLGALVIGGVLLSKYLGRRSQLKGLASGEIDLDDEDFGSDPFFAKIKRDKEIRRERLRDAFALSPAIIVKDKTGRETLLIKSGETANPEQGAFRVSSFAHDGPIGHVTRKTPEVLIEEIADDFYPVDARPAFDEEVMDWTSTQEFERGAERVAAVQRANARGHVEEVAVITVTKPLGVVPPKRLTKAQIAKLRIELRRAVKSEQAFVGGPRAMKIDDFERASSRAARAAGIADRVAFQPSDGGVEFWEKVGGETDIDAGQIAEYHAEIEGGYRGLKDLSARKKRVVESQELQELREAKERYLSALNYAGNTDEQVREYHRKLDEISEKMKALR